MNNLKKGPKYIGVKFANNTQRAEKANCREHQESREDESKGRGGKCLEDEQQSEIFTL